MTPQQCETIWINAVTRQVVYANQGLDCQPAEFKHHSQDVKYHPEKYGLTADDLKSIPREIKGSKRAKTARFDHDLMQWMMDKGWVRVNAYRKQVEYQGTADRHVRAAIRHFLEVMPEQNNARIAITPLLEKGSDMFMAEMISREDIHRYADKGILPPGAGLTTTFS